MRSRRPREGYRLLDEKTEEVQRGGEDNLNNLIRQTSRPTTSVFLLSSRRRAARKAPSLAHKDAARSGSVAFLFANYSLSHIKGTDGQWSPFFGPFLLLTSQLVFPADLMPYEGQKLGQSDSQFPCAVFSIKLRLLPWDRGKKGKEEEGPPEWKGTSTLGKGERSPSSPMSEWAQKRRRKDQKDERQAPPILTTVFQCNPGPTASKLPRVFSPSPVRYIMHERE